MPQAGSQAALHGLPLRLLVTRPAAQAAPELARLRDAGWDAQALPLLAIDPARDAQQLAAAQAALTALAGAEPGDAAVFVSPSAVAHALAGLRAPWPHGVAAAAVGPGTRAALVQAGVPEEALVAPAAPPFESEALWPLLAPRLRVGARVWLFRGEGGREWLAQALRAAGHRVQALACYRRVAPVWSAAEQALAQAALAAPARHVWLLSSSEGVGKIPTLLPQARGADWARAVAIAPHPRIAAAARALGFGQVVLVDGTAPTTARALAALAAERAAPQP